MTRAQALRLIRRAVTWARFAAGEAGELDPITGQMIGTFSLPEAAEHGRASIGPHSYSGARIRIAQGSTGRVDVGDYCSIAGGVLFMLGGNHRTDWVSTFPLRSELGMEGAFADGHPRPDGGILVGNDVWIGTEALILPNVTVGDGAVIGARAVVTRDVAPYTIVGGVPARALRTRFSEEQIAALLELRWWDWPEAQVRAHVHLLNSPDVDGLIAAGRSLAARDRAVQDRPASARS